MIKKLLGEQLYKVLSYNGVVVIGKLVSSFVVSKVSAVFLGPAGFAILGNFKNALQVFLGVSVSGLESGIIKYISENRKNKDRLKKVVVNAMALNVLIGLIVAPFFFLFSNELADYVLKDSSYYYIFKALAFLFPLISMSFLVTYILNGLQEFKLYTIILSIANFLNAFLTFLFIYFLGLEGALLASMVIPGLSFMVSMMFRKIRVLILESFNSLKDISLGFIKSISAYLLMAIYSTVLIGISYFLIRNSIIASISTETAGLWEAMNKISMFYLIFFSSLLTLYLLPRLSENFTIRGYGLIMRDFLKTLIPLLVISFMALFFLRTFVIKLFLTNDFLEIERYFHLQLLGDFFKIIGFALAMQFHAKKILLHYYLTDAILYGVFYFASIHLLKAFELQGVFYAYVISTFLYFVAVLLSVSITKKKYLLLDE